MKDKVCEPARRRGRRYFGFSSRQPQRNYQQRWVVIILSRQNKLLAQGWLVGCGTTQPVCGGRGWTVKIDILVCTAERGTESLPTGSLVVPGRFLVVPG